MTDELKSVVDAIAKSLKIDPTQLLESVKSGDGIDLDKLGTRIEETRDKAVQHAKDQAKEAQKNLLSKGIKDRMEAIEAKLRAPLSIDTEKTGEDFIDAVLAQVKGLQDASLSEDKVRSHPAYIEAVSNAKDEGREEYKKKFEDKSEELEKFQTETKRNQVLSIVKEKAVEMFSKANIIDSAGEDARKSMLRNFIRDLNDYDYIIDSEGNPQVVDDSGQPKKDDLGNLIQFSNVTEKAFKANVFVKPGKPRSTPGEGDTGGDSNGDFKFSKDYKGPQLPETIEESYKILAELNDKAGRAEVSMATIAEYGSAHEAKFLSKE